MNWFYAAVWWASILTGCSHTVAFTVPPDETLGVQVYGSGRPNSECQVLPGSAEQKLLTAWLEQNKEGWKGTPASYVPSVLVSGKVFSINFLGSSAILNYDKGQYAHPIEPKQYEFLVCAKRTQQGAPGDAPKAARP